jgi:hypothetical protein
VISITTLHSTDPVKHQPHFYTFFIFALAGCLFLRVPVQAQNKDSLAGDHYLEIELGGSFYINSNAITGEFMSAFYKGGFITTEMKDRSQKKLRYSNRIGGDLDYGIGVTWKPDSLWHYRNVTVNFSLKDRFHYDAGFSRDLFNVVMYGNKSYAGKTADLGNFSLNTLRYQQLKAGLEWEGDTAHGSYGMAVSLLKGEKDMLIDADRAFLTTSADGTKIDFALSMNMRQTDTANTGPGAFNGGGISTDLFYEMPYLTWYNEGLLKLEVNDLGFIRWNTKSVHYAVDSMYSYTGITIDNIIDLQQNTLPQGNPDSIIRNNVKYGTEPYTRILPALFTVTATTYYGKKFVWEKGMRFRMASNCRPYYYSTFSWYVTKDLETTVTAAYGGYGGFTTGLELDYTFPKQFHLHLDSYYLGGYLAPEHFCGLGAAASLSKRF